MRKLLSTALIAALIVSMTPMLGINTSISNTGHVYAETIPIDEEHFPDENFRNYLTKKHGSSFDPTSVKNLDVFNQSIESLEGLQYFTALEDLYCGNNKLSSLDVSHNVALKDLYCSYNNLSSLDVSHNIALFYLDCEKNNLSSLDVSHNSALRGLKCLSNNLSSLDISHNTALAYLDCYENNLSSLDVSKNTALTTLSCGYNSINSLDVSHNTALEQLHCYGNNLSSLDVSHNTALEQLYCDSNNLSSLDVSHNAALKDLSFNYNNLSSLDVSHNTALETLDCFYNALNALDVSHNTALVSLGCSKNNLSSLDVSHNNALESLDCSNNKLNNLDVSHNTALVELNCIESNLSSLDVSHNKALEILRCYENNLSNLDVSHNTLLRILHCTQNKIGKLYVYDELPEYCWYDEGVEIVYVSGNPSDRRYKLYPTFTKYLNQKDFDEAPSIRNTLRNSMNTELSGPVPGIIKTNISDGTACLTSIRYVPQGLCEFDSYYLVTAYEKPRKPKKNEEAEKPKHSVIYVLDSNWDLKTTVTIGDYAFHNGGIAYDPENGGVLWFCGNTEPEYTGTPFVYRLDAGKLREAISSGDKMVHIDSFTAGKVYINNKPSCLDYHNGRLWVGTCGSSKGSIVGYKTDGINIDTDNTVHVTNVEKKLNGFKFDGDGTLYASYSSGRGRENYSKIDRYNLSGSYSKGSILNAEKASSIDVPRMNEEIMILDGYLYILYESGAEEYGDAFIRTDRITPLPTSLWSNGTLNSPAKMMAMGNSGVSSINTGEPQTISFRYSSSEDVNETTHDLTFTPEESGMYTISVRDLNGSDNVFVTTEVTDGENYLGNATTAEYRYQEEDETGLPYDFYDGSSCKVFLTGGKTYKISLTADILELYDPETYEAEEPLVEYSGSYNLTVSGETDLSAVVPEAVEGEEKTLAVSEGEAGCFCFTPEKSGTYRIDLSSDGTLGDILILKDMKEEVTFNGVLCDLEAGKKYYFITSLSERGDSRAESEIHFSAYRLESEELRTGEPVKVTGDTYMTYTATDDGIKIIKVEGGTVEQITVFDQNGDTIAAGDGDVLFETKKNENYRIMCTGCNGEISVSISAYSEDDPDTPDDPTPVDPTPVDPVDPQPTPVDPTPINPQPAPVVTPTVPAAPAEIVDLPAVKISKPKAAKKKITVKWKKVSKKNLKKIGGIQIQVATDPGFTNIVKTATAGKKKTSKVIKGMSPKTKYYVRIRAYAAGNHVSSWKSKSVKVK